MPRALDLFGGEGGAAYGYHLGGWDVTVVDDIDRPNRAPGVTWVTGDALTYPLDGFDLVTGSPPCTGHSTLRNAADVARGGRTAGTEWMLEHTIARLRAWGGPYIVENVEGAKSRMDGAFTLCGSMFDLTDGPWLLKRHRLFLTNLPIMLPFHCTCRGRDVIGVYGDLTPQDRRCAGRRINRPNGDMRAGVARARRLMGMPWASPEGLTLAIPPAYTKWLGEQALDLIGACHA